jgi:hypothetical protein
MNVMGISFRAEIAIFDKAKIKRIIISCLFLLAGPAPCLVRISDLGLVTALSAAYRNL